MKDDEWPEVATMPGAEKVAAELPWPRRLSNEESDAYSRGYRDGWDHGYRCGHDSE